MIQSLAFMLKKTGNAIYVDVERKLKKAIETYNIMPLWSLMKKNLKDLSKKRITDTTVHCNHKLIMRTESHY